MPMPEQRIPRQPARPIGVILGLAIGLSCAMLLIVHFASGAAIDWVFVAEATIGLMAGIAVACSAWIGRGPVGR